MAIDSTTDSIPTSGLRDIPGAGMSHGTLIGRWAARIIAALILVATLAFVAALVARSLPARASGPVLTQRVTRGDLVVTVTEQGLLESAENVEIKCKVRGRNTVLWVVDSGTMVEPGDELVRLDALFIQEQIDERTKYAHWSRSAAERSAANVTRATLAVSEYDQGRYIAEQMKLEKDLVVAESQLRAARDALSHAELMQESEYISEVELEQREFAVKQAELDVRLKRTEIDVLKRFTRAEQLQTLNGNLASAKANHDANVERAMADASRRDRALGELKHCSVVADRSGMVIHPNAAKWETGPIAEGSTVHKDQVLLLMPDLTQMQVKIGIHESYLDRVKVGLPARVTLPDKTLDGKVAKVASVTRPAGWWTANEVRYDTHVGLPNVLGLMPGMSAEVEVVLARYENVLRIPVAAIVETDEAAFCWVKSDGPPARRTLLLGDSNNVFTIVEKGLTEGEEVILNPLALREARELAAPQSDADGMSSKPTSKPAS